MITRDRGRATALQALDQEPLLSGQFGASRRRVMLSALLLAGAAWLGMGTDARAALAVTPTTLVLDLAPGADGIVRGDITNTTGFDLLSTDFFGSFSGFPAGALIVDQLLGLTDIAIDDRSIGRDLALFSVRLGAGALAGERYVIEFFFGEINGNFSDAATVFVDVPGAQVPEPGVAWLVGGGGLLGLAAARRRRPVPTLKEA